MTKRLTKHVPAMRKKVAEDRRTAHAALEQVETLIFERADRLARREQDRAASRARSGLGVGR